MATKFEWTKEYCGVTHYGDSSGFRRASIHVYNDMCELLKWYKGCGFSPEKVLYSSVEEAKKAGEEWTHKGI